jgi:5-formyltetrahydrofolate cyclo-ligase
MKTKAEFRKQLKEARLEMLDEEHRLASAAIVERLKTGVNWLEIKSVHLFTPIQELAEVDINGFIQFMEDEYPGAGLSTSKLIEDKWEILSLHGGKPPKQVDVVIVPMLGFDPQTLHRIGYGGGYYDKFLAQQKSASKIGVCFEQGSVNGLPVESHDIPMNMIITEA